MRQVFYSLKLLVTVSTVLIALGGCVTEMTREDVAAEYYNLGNGFFDLGRYARAISYYELALKRDPELLAAKWNLALAYMRAKQYEPAERILLDWVESDPDSVEAREALAFVYRGQGRAQEALDMLRSVLAIAPEDTTALNNVAVILWAEGRRRESLDFFLKLLSFQPYDLRTLFNLALLESELQETERSLQYAEAYLALIESGERDEEKDILRAYYIAAQAYTERQEYYQALDLYAGILKRDEHQGDAWFEQARILLTSVEDPEKGLESLARALEEGFADRNAIAGLLEDPALLDEERVRELLREKNRLPPEREGGGDAASGGQTSGEPATGPTGPPPAP